LLFVGFSCLIYTTITDNFVLPIIKRKNMDNTSIKTNIRNKRKEKNFTQEEMAHRLGISLTAYRDFEKGGTSIVNGNIMKLADILETTTEELVLGYRPSKDHAVVLEDVRTEYGSRISNLEEKVEYLEKLVSSLEETIATKNEIITLLRKTLDEAK